MVNDGEECDIGVWGIKKTARSVDGVEVLEVTLMVNTEAGGGGRTFTGWVYPEKVELKSDPDAWNLHPDDLRDLMYEAAGDWYLQFDDWGTTILSREEPVGDV